MSIKDVSIKAGVLCRYYQSWRFSLPLYTFNINAGNPPSLCVRSVSQLVPFLVLIKLCNPPSLYTSLIFTCSQYQCWHLSFSCREYLGWRPPSLYTPSKKCCRPSSLHAVGINADPSLSLNTSFSLYGASPSLYMAPLLLFIWRPSFSLYDAPPSLYMAPLLLFTRIWRQTQGFSLSNIGLKVLPFLSRRRSFDSMFRIQINAPYKLTKCELPTKDTSLSLFLFQFLSVCQCFCIPVR